MSGSHLQDVDPEMASKLTEVVAECDEFLRRYRAIRAAVPGTGSRAEADRQIPDGRYVEVHAIQGAHMAIDHLLAWKLLVDGRLYPIVAQMTLLRGGFEGAVRCRWLVDAKKRPSTRVARGWAAKRHDYEERERYELARPREERTRRMSATERLAWLDARRELAKVESVGYADVTSLMMKYGYEKPYRLTSGFAHAQEWPYAKTTIVDLRPSFPGVVTGVVSADDAVVLDLTKRSFAAVRNAISDLEGYYTPRRAHARV